jgi:hypothetical protein
MVLLPALLVPLGVAAFLLFMARFEDAVLGRGPDPEDDLDAGVVPLEPRTPPAPPGVDEDRRAA